MSQLRKAIEKLQRGDGPRMGFGQVAREKPRAVLLGALVRDATAGQQAVEAGVDLLIVRSDDAAGAARALNEIGDVKPFRGVWLNELGIDDGKVMVDAGVDFVASPLDGTIAEAVDGDAIGQVLAVTRDMEEATLRALGPLGLDALFVKRPGGEMTLAQQVELARLAMLSGVPLLINAPATLSTGELRVLRDSGAAAIVAAEGTTSDELKALSDRLREVPPRSKRRGEAREIALVPSVPSGGDEHDHEHDDD